MQKHPKSGSIEHAIQHIYYKIIITIIILLNTTASHAEFSLDKMKKEMMDVIDEVKKTVEETKQSKPAQQQNNSLAIAVAPIPESRSSLTFSIHS